MKSVIKTKQHTKNTDKITERILSDKRVRKAVCSQDLMWFFRIYFSEYIKYEIANFQLEILKLLQDAGNELITVVAFRDSAKSTFCSLLLPIWSIVGAHQKKFVLIVCQTSQKAKNTLKNIRNKLVEAGLLLDDFGAFCEDDEWNQNTLVIPKYGARITAISTGESIRGLIHREHRPDLIVCDDLEDVQSAKTKEGRDKLWGFVSGELIPAGSRDARLIFVGNLIHEDSLMMKLKQKIQTGKLSGVYKKYPLITDDKKILWSGKFPDFKSIERLKKRQPSENDYLREYMLKIVPPEDVIIRRENIHYYNQLPDFEEHRPRLIACGVDPAISIKASADYTAIVLALVFGYGKDLKIYILPQVINKRMLFPETCKEIIRLNAQLHAQYKIQPTFYIESVVYQAALAQHLNVEGIHAESVGIGKLDKRARLSIVSPYIESGKILFPHQGCEDLINQVVNFGVEKHDDQADALTIMVLRIIEDNFPAPAPFPDPVKGTGSIFGNFGGIAKNTGGGITSGWLDKKF